MEVKGKIEKVFETQQVTDSFKKREFVLLVQDGQYPQYIKFEIHGANVDKLTPVEGEEVTVKYNLRGRPYEKDGKTMYFNTIVAWSIYKEQTQAPQPSAPVNTPPPAPSVTNDDGPDGLPF